MLSKSWQRASGNSGNCFEARLATDPDTGEDTVEVRNSREPDGAIVRYSRTEWRATVRAFKRGMFDLEATRARSRRYGSSGQERPRREPVGSPRSRR